MKYELTISLKSDLCASSGDSFGSYIDSDVCYDGMGIPYIPSKRLKGLIREAAEEYCDWNEELSPYMKSIFGEEGSRNPGKLKIDNAYIRGYFTIVEELNQLPEKYRKYIAKQRIINAYTYTRYQTAIDEKTGTSLDNSLRSTRVVKQGNRFVAEIEIDANEQEIQLLRNAVTLCQHMGMNRSRGYGEIVCRFKPKDRNPVIKEFVEEIMGVEKKEEEKKLEINYEDETNCEIQILLKSEAEIMVSKQNAESSENYIPGSNLLGCIAKRYIEENNITDFENMSEEFIDLFLNGNVKYENAYISEKDGKQYFPIPFSYTKVKNTKDRFYNKMFEVQEENIQLSGITDKFVTLDGTDFIKEVKFSENYHHQRPKDRSIGHATSKEDGGTLYQYTAIDKNQYFLGRIIGKAKYLKQIARYLAKGETIRVGKSKSTEYGKMSIQRVTVNEIKDDAKLYKKFAVILTSNVIIMDSAKVTIQKEKIVNVLKNILGQDIKLDRAFINYEKVSGYNILWNLPKEQLESFKAGSVFVFESENGVNLKENYTIGQRKSEGYGNIRIVDIEGKNEKLDLKKYKEEKQEKTLEELSEGTKDLLKRIVKETISDDIIYNVIDTVSGEYKLNNSTIGRLLLMLKQSNKTEEFFANVAAIKNDKKLKKVEKLLKGKEDNLLQLESRKNYEELEEKQKIDYEKYKLEYIKQILTQLKIEGGNK